MQMPRLLCANTLDVYYGVNEHCRISIDIYTLAIIDAQFASIKTLIDDNHKSFLWPEKKARLWIYYLN